LECEMALAKLRRLRYRSDYSMRLFLAAMDEGSWMGNMRFRGPGQCPRCGRPERDSTRRRSRVN